MNSAVTYIVIGYFAVAIFTTLYNFIDTRRRLRLGTLSDCR